jgi:hypothetical protein
VSPGKPGPGPMRWGARLLCALFIVLSGCTAVQIAYNNADSLLHWRARQYFGFENGQKDEFERRVQHFLAWHRKTELPRYARLADDLANRLSRGVSQADLVWGYDAFQAYLRQSLRAGTDEIAGLLDGLAPEQIERFQERLEKENREFSKEYGLGETPGERREIRVKRNIKRMEEWFGPLGDPQVERIALYSRRAPLDDELRLRDRKRMQAELVAMLKKKEARRKLVAWAVAWEQNRDPAYDAMRKENLQEFYAMLLDLDKTLSAEQRGMAVRRLRGFAGDFNSLAAAVEAAR